MSPMPRAQYILLTILVLALNLLTVGCTPVVAVSGTATGVPSITSLSPVRTTAGSAGFTLTVEGANFTDGSTVLWNDNDLVTTFVSATELTAEIPASSLVAAGAATVNGSNPPPGGGRSGGAVIDIEASNPVPAISSLAPASV